MGDAYTLAKNLVDYDTTDTGLVAIFANCETPAYLLLQEYLSDKDSSRYNTTQSLTFSKAEAYGDTNNEKTKLTLNTVTLLKVTDLIEIATGTYAGKYSILDIDSLNKTITILKTFSATASGTLVNLSIAKYLYAHAYLILYKLCLNAQTIVKGDIIYSSQQFGQGNIAPATQENKKLLAQRYFNEALNFIGNVRCL
jgi:hypothetical protein